MRTRTSYGQAFLETCSAAAPQDERDGSGGRGYPVDRHGLACCHAKAAGWDLKGILELRVGCWILSACE